MTEAHPLPGDTFLVPVAGRPTVLSRADAGALLVTLCILLAASSDSDGGGGGLGGPSAMGRQGA